MYTIWHSTRSLADYLVDNTVLANERARGRIRFKKMYESDANNSTKFHTMPTHLKTILYLDAPDIIVEQNSKPVLSLEVSTEAGTGHNAFQRFARIAASVENGVPAFYIYPEGAYIIRQNDPTGRWDRLNPMIFNALEKTMRIYNIPALLYYFPSQINDNDEEEIVNKGLKRDATYPSCPDGSDQEMQSMFEAINEVLNFYRRHGNLSGVMGRQVIQNRRDFMITEEHAKRMGRTNWSPLTATEVIRTTKLIDYLRNYTSRTHNFGDMLTSRENTVVYKVDANFRGDPYPGALSALDYLKCRSGLTFEERNMNLVMAWGNFTTNQGGDISITGNRQKSVNEFVNSVRDTYSDPNKILLGRRYNQLTGSQIPRYFMQVRFGSTFTKVKHIRVYSYYCDAILFHDGALWREG